jgi:hypothetical protein
MAKKLSLLIAAIAVLAFAVPSMASAAEATCPAGTKCPVGTEITGAGTNINLTSSTLGEINCESLTLKGAITKNDGTTVEGSGNNVSPTQAGCFNKEKSRPVTVTEVNLTSLVASEAAKAGSSRNGTVSFTATVDLPAGIVCKFTGTKVPGTYVSGANPAVLSFNKGAGITSTGGCGTATLDGSFKLSKTSGGSALVID